MWGGFRVVEWATPGAWGSAWVYVEPIASEVPGADISGSGRSEVGPDDEGAQEHTGPAAQASGSSDLRVAWPAMRPGSGPPDNELHRAQPSPEPRSAISSTILRVCDVPDQAKTLFKTTPATSV